MLNYALRTQMYNIGVAVHNACVQHIKRMPISTIDEIKAKGLLLDIALKTNSAISTNRMDSIWRG